MQCLASLAVGLQLDQLLCRPPVPPHLLECPPESGSGVWSTSEWAWLDCFSTTVKVAEALARGATFPESFSVPDLEPVSKDERSLLMVRALDKAIRPTAVMSPASNNRLSFQDNSKWAPGIDEQIMSWATSRPEVMYMSLDKAVGGTLGRNLPPVCRTGTWGGSVTCSCGEQDATASWQRLAGTSWCPRLPLHFPRPNRCAKKHICVCLAITKMRLDKNQFEI